MLISLRFMNNSEGNVFIAKRSRDIRQFTGERRAIPASVPAKTPKGVTVLTKVQVKTIYVFQSVLLNITTSDQCYSQETYLYNTAFKLKNPTCHTLFTDQTIVQLLIYFSFNLCLSINQSRTISM